MIITHQTIDEFDSRGYPAHADHRTSFRDQTVRQAVSTPGGETVAVMASLVKEAGDLGRCIIQRKGGNCDSAFQRDDFKDDRIGRQCPVQAPCHEQRDDLRSMSEPPPGPFGGLNPDKGSSSDGRSGSKKCVRLGLMLVLLGSTLTSCRNDPVTLSATDPLARIVVRPGEALVYAAPGVRLHDVVSIEPFLEQGLRPGMTVVEVTELLGEPDYLTRDRDGRDEVFGFHYETGDFEVVKQHVSSEGTEVDRWFLRYRPRHCSPLLDQRFLKQVQKVEPFPSEVTVFAGPEHNGVATLEFDDEHTCSTIWWLLRD